MHNTLYRRFCLPLIGLALSLLLEQCYGVFQYSTTHAPNLSKSKEGHLNILPGVDHAEVQEAYSPKDHLGMMVNACASYPFAEPSGTGTMNAELAGGRYHSFCNDTATHCSWFYDAYLGFGIGQRKYTGLIGFVGPSGIGDEYSVSASFEKFFLQSSVFYKKGRNELAITVQAGEYYLNNFNCYLLKDNGSTLPQPSLISSFDGQSFFNLNSAITYTRHFKNFRFMIQLANNTLLSYPPGWSYYGYQAIQMPWTGRFLELNGGFQFSF